MLPLAAARVKRDAAVPLPTPPLLELSRGTCALCTATRPVVSRGCPSTKAMPNVGVLGTVH